MVLILLYFIGFLKNISFDWNDIIHSIHVYSQQTDNVTIVKGVDLDLSPIPSFPNCKTIDIQRHFPNLYAPKQIFIKFKNISKNLGVELYMLDINLASRRSLKSQLLAYSGPILVNSKLARIKEEKYILKITQTKEAEENKNTGCQDYPNEEYQTFSDCDAEFVHEQMLGEGVMPFWATNNLDEITAFR